MPVWTSIAPPRGGLPGPVTVAAPPGASHARHQRHPPAEGERRLWLTGSGARIPAGGRAPPPPLVLTVEKHWLVAASKCEKVERKEKRGGRAVVGEGEKYLQDPLRVLEGADRPHG